MEILRDKDGKHLEKSEHIGNIKGNIKDRNFEIMIGETARETKVLCNGKPLECVSELTLKIKPEKRPRLTMKTIMVKGD